MREVDELRPLTAARLLTLWQECGDMAEETMERALLCNARVLAESCFYQGEPVFVDGEAVLEGMTTREMETLLRYLAEGRAPAAASENPAFDQARFQRLRRESV